MRIYLQKNGNRFSSADLYILLNQLQIAGIPTEGAGRVGQRCAILIDKEKDLDRAIAVLAKSGVDATRC
jgi:hypothetical protein